MKKTNNCHRKVFSTRMYFILITSLLLTVLKVSAQVGINKDNSEPDTNSILHVKGDATKKNIVIEPGATGGVGIGTTSPDAMLEVVGQVKITGGTPGVDKVLTSDANGLAEWATPAPNVGNYGTVTNPITGKTWLDRNLGASQVATSLTDANAYGDLYQWGRAQDGHEDRGSTTHNGQATDWLADEGSNAWDEKFIIENSDWLNPANDALWKGTDAENNPCPSGFRIPTNAEWNQERRTWEHNNSAGAFSSVLKLPNGGYRRFFTGNLSTIGVGGCLWCREVTASNARVMIFFSSNAYLIATERANGYSIRCIKD